MQALPGDARHGASPVMRVEGQKVKKGEQSAELNVKSKCGTFRADEAKMLNSERLNRLSPISTLSIRG